MPSTQRSAIHLDLNAYWSDFYEYFALIAGGFSGNIHHDAHLLYTLSAVQVLALFDALDKLDKDSVASCITPLFFFFSSLVHDEKLIACFACTRRCQIATSRWFFHWR